MEYLAHAGSCGSTWTWDPNYYAPAGTCPGVTFGQGKPCLVLLRVCWLDSWAVIEKVKVPRNATTFKFFVYQMYQTGCYLSLNLSLKIAEQDGTEWEFDSKGMSLTTIHWKGNTKALKLNEHIRECVIEKVEIPAQFKGKTVAIGVNFNHRDETENGNWKTKWHLEGVSVIFD